MRLTTRDSISLPTTSIRIMHDTLRAEGIDSSKVFEMANVDREVLDDPASTISWSVEIRFQKAFIEATRSIPGAWFRTGLKYRLLSYGALGQAVMVAATVAEALAVLAAYQALTFSLMVYRVEIEDGEILSLTGDDSDAPASMREFLQERSLGSGTMFLHDIQPPRFPLKHIESALERPPGWLGLEEQLGVPIIFNAPRTRWVFRPGTGHLELPMSSSVLELNYKRLCEELISRNDIGSPFTREVFEIILSSSRFAHTAGLVAERLGVSERTLHRKLAADGENFRNVLAKVLQQRAKELLSNTSLTIEQISELLGYSETSSFSRAFQRWTGKSPLSFRRS